jgi:hypothetical protein
MTLDLIETWLLGLPVFRHLCVLGNAMLLLSRVAFSCALFLGIQPAAAQQPKAANAQPKQEQMTMSTVTLVLLIKGTVLALHQANVTGNYSVLRDMGTPIFRERFDQAALTAAFANLRARKIDLSMAILATPNLTKNPEMNSNGELVVVGDFPTQPLMIHFELMFLQLDGNWRLAGLGVDAVPPPNAQASAAPAQPAAPAAPAGKKGPAKPKS